MSGIPNKPDLGSHGPIMSKRGPLSTGVPLLERNGRREKRTRISKACEHCRLRKVKCNGDQPCETCWSHRLSCVYRERARLRSKLSPSAAPTPAGQTEDIEEVISSGARYSPEEYRQQLELRAGIGVSNSQTGSFQFFGPSSHFCFIQRIYQRMKRQCHGTLLEQQRRAVPDGLQQWGLERFMFSAGSNTLNPANSSTEAFLSKETGYRFIAAYFTIIHPHMPILNQGVVEELWEKLWAAPVVTRDVKSKDVVYMVLALGARTIARDNGSSAETLDSWADYFWAQSNELHSLFQEPSLRGIHLLLLKAMYALHGMRPNDAYLYLGHAARSALALGLNRSQVANGNGSTMHRLRVTFWVVYYYERICAFFTGRPSGFLDTHIDVAFPEDFTTEENDILGGISHAIDGPNIKCSFLRGMSRIGQLVEKVSSGIFSLANLQTLYDSRHVEMTIVECDNSLQKLMADLPSYLSFFDRSRPRGQTWQEIQCTHIGLAFHLIRMMNHRPALVSSNLSPSNEVSGDSDPSEKASSVQRSIGISVDSAKEIIEIASNAIFQRATCIRNDASVANYIVSACVTLLFNVLSSSVSVVDARDIFVSVEQGIHCLDQMEHMGPITGKALSMDIMKSAKDALALSNSNQNLEQGLAEIFPWLNEVFTPPKNGQPLDAIDHPINANSSFTAPLGQAEDPAVGDIGNADEYLSASISGVNYTSYWLNGDYNSLDFLDSL